MSANIDDTTTSERLLPDPDDRGFVLQLFVSGMSPRSTSAIKNIKAVCDELLLGRYTLEVVDLYDDPQTARLNHVLASPTLLRHRPLPVRRLIGDLSDRATVLRTLGIA